jgi:deoxyribodipyrimidine photo-lyase
MNNVPPIRIRKTNQAAVNEKGSYVLYWIIASRRIRFNFGLQRAVEMAVRLDKPIMILEALRSGYPWACDRFHYFIIAGMADNSRELQDCPFVHYYPYVEPKIDGGKGLLSALAKDACMVITDDFPAFFLPRMEAAASEAIPVALEAVDGNGLLPLRAADRAYPTAYAFRRFLQKALPNHLTAAPDADPLKGLDLPKAKAIPVTILSRWPEASGLLKKTHPDLDRFPIDHQVPPSSMRGGAQEARRQMEAFIRRRLTVYDTDRNHPDEDAASGLSPYLHFGHISAHEVFNAIAEHEEWSLHRLSETAKGSRSGWWGMSPSAEAFLDQLVTWRELGCNMCAFRDDYARFESLPDWAKATLEAHARDKRPYTYDPATLEQAQTHDPIWNAAQRQLVVEGRIHNYLRMLWGKKILEWSASPRQAVEAMIALNDKYALDGRDPNSYSGIFWCLGRYDRPWGPERPIFGKVRYMSSKNTARKIRISDYLAAWGPEAVRWPQDGEQSHRHE